MMKEKTMVAIALRGITILPAMTIHLDINRRKSVESANKAMTSDQMVYLVTQKEITSQNPALSQLYTMGTIAKIKQIMKTPNGDIRILVEGVKRAKLLELDEEGECLVATIQEIEEEMIEDVEQKALIQLLQERLERYKKENPSASKEFDTIGSETHLSRALDIIIAHLHLNQKGRQEYLQVETVMDRFHYVMEVIEEEIQVQRVKRNFQAQVKHRIDKHQKEFLLREQLKVIHEELGESVNPSYEADRMEERLSALRADKVVKERIQREIKRFKSLPGASQDAGLTQTYIETSLDMPWNKKKKEHLDLKKVEQVLNEEHYGLEKVKERVIEYLAVRKLNGKGESPILCFVGPPGTGKTSIATSIAKALHREYVRISLGGVRDEAEIRGHRKTYLGAMPGRIANGLRQAKVKNPLMVLDEIDKLGSDYKGDPSAALLEVLDGEQNKTFRDHFIELPMDLSEIMFIATANSLETIPRPLLDRMEVIEVSSYTENEKFHIAFEHLMKKQLRKHGLNEHQLLIEDNAIRKVIRNYTREAGVRGLERQIGQLCRKAAKEILLDGKKEIYITERNLEQYLGKEKISFEDANEQDEVGIVRGLAWTSVGGDTLQIEVNVMPGKGAMQLTGQLGDVMKESAKTALSYVRSVASSYGVASDYFETHDIHIHIPEGAVPKDGPSAGITMATAILSAVTEKKVSAKVAMTGEITLRGRVLAIGGLKEKILAAKLAHITTVLVPEKNRPNVEELSSEIVDGLNIVFVTHMEEVLKEALVC